MDSHLHNNLLLFGRILHNLGFDVTPARMIDVMDSLQYVNIGNRSDFYFTLRGLCVNHKHELPLFDEAFGIFWQKPTEGGMDLSLGDLISDKPAEEQPTVVNPAEMQEFQSGEEPDEPDEDTEEIIELTQTYSTIERLANKDFEDMTADELAQVKKIMLDMVWRLGNRKTRRQTSGKGTTLDLRRTLRNSFRTGGELLDWRTTTPKIKPRPLVIIADISGSMEQYSRVLLHFLYSLAGGLDQKVEIFLFSTHLTRITRELKNKDIDQAVSDVSQAVKDWSGGTQIGDVLHDFNYTWGRRVLRGGAIVLLISDGWDRGDPDLLGKEIGRLQRTAHRLIWLNPLLGSDEYEPLTRGMVAALPHIDDFLPVHNLNSLESLAAHLALVGDGKRAQAAVTGAAFTT